MNKDLIYLKNSKDSYMKVLFLTLIMTSTFGFYKNIICLLNENVNEKIIIKAILFPLLGFVLGFVFDYLKNKSLKIDYNSLTGFLVGMHASINLNVLVFILSFFVLFMLNKLDKNNYFNKPAILMLLLALIMVFSGSYDYQNILEKKYLYDYSYLDKLIGHQVGGLFNTSVLLMIISYIILSFNKLYKKDIFIVSYFTYLIVLLIIFIIGKNYKWDLLINSNTIFYLVFIASLNIPEIDLFERVNFIYQKAHFEVVFGDTSAIETMKKCQYIFERCESYQIALKLEQEIKSLETVVKTR